MFILQLTTEYYLFFSILYLLILMVYVQYNTKLQFPNVYNSILYLAILILLNCIVIAFCISNDLFIDTIEYKINTGNYSIKIFLLLFTVFYLLYSKNAIYILHIKYIEHVWLILTSIFSLSMLMVTNDFILLLIILEIQSILAYVLTSIIKKKKVAIQSAIKYYILNSFAAMLLLFGYSLIYGMYGIHNFVELKLLLEQNTIWCTNNNLLFFSFLLIIVALLFKLYAAPFHFWVSDIYQGTTIFIASFFSTITTLPVYYLFVKVYLLYFNAFSIKFDAILFFFGILSMFFAFVSAIYQKNIKKIIAYSSINTTGYFLISISQQDPFSLQNIFIYLLLYITNLTGILIVLNNVYLTRLNSFIEQLQHLNQIYQNNLPYAMLLMLLIFSVAGIPFFSIFISKSIILIGILENYNTKYIYLVICLAVISSLFYLNMVKYLFYYKTINVVYIQPINYITSILYCLFSFFNFFFFLEISYFSVMTESVMLSIY